MNSKVISKIKRINKLKPISPQTAYTSEFQVKGDNLVLQLPKGILNYLKFPHNKICWTLINNTIQISPQKLSFFIPAIDLNKDEFESHKN